MKHLIVYLGLALAVAAAPEYPQLGPDIYDPKADGAELISAARREASAQHKHVLVMFGANWCIWCHRLHALLHDNPEVSRVLRDNYELVMIDVNQRHGVARNAALDARYGHPTRLGLPVLVVLDADGRPLTTKDSGDWRMERTDMTRRRCLPSSAPGRRPGSRLTHREECAAGRRRGSRPAHAGVDGT